MSTGSGVCGRENSPELSIVWVSNSNEFVGKIAEKEEIAQQQASRNSSMPKEMAANELLFHGTAVNSSSSINRCTQLSHLTPLCPPSWLYTLMTRNNSKNNCCNHYYLQELPEQRHHPV